MPETLFCMPLRGVARFWWQVPELLEPGMTAYVCGPVPFMAGVQDDLHALGFDTARLFQESFSF